MVAIQLDGTLRRGLLTELKSDADWEVDFFVLSRSLEEKLVCPSI